MSIRTLQFLQPPFSHIFGDYRHRVCSRVAALNKYVKLKDVLCRFPRLCNRTPGRKGKRGTRAALDHLVPLERGCEHERNFLEVKPSQKKNVYNRVEGLR